MKPNHLNSSLHTQCSEDLATAFSLESAQFCATLKPQKLAALRTLQRYHDVVLNHGAVTLTTQINSDLEHAPSKAITLSHLCYCHSLLISLKPKVTIQPAEERLASKEQALLEHLFPDPPKTLSALDPNSLEYLIQSTHTFRDEIRFALSKTINDFAATPFVELEKLAEKIFATPDGAVRHAYAQHLKDQLALVFRNYRFSSDAISPLSKLSLKTFLLAAETPRFASLRGDTGRASHVPVKNSLELARGAISLSEELPKVLCKIQKRAQSTFDNLRGQFGAKAANTILDSELLNASAEFLETQSVNAIIPDFMPVPVSLYTDWKNGNEIDAKLRDIYTWIRGRAVMVRSSARDSEDGVITGAGIYSSEVVSGAASFAEFRQAVISVYRSTDSDAARAYRSKHGMSDEVMGLLIQEHVSSLGFASWYYGYANSARAGAAELIDIKFQGGARPQIVRQKLEIALTRKELTNFSQNAELLYHPVDQSHGRHTASALVAFLAYFLERSRGTPCQIEFAVGQGVHGTELILLQSRQLPKGIGERPQTTLPQHLEMLCEVDCLGACDNEFDISLDYLRANSSRLVILSTSHFASMYNFEQYLPKHGAVWVAEQWEDKTGHIETLAEEAGLLLLFGPGRAATPHAMNSAFAWSKLTEVHQASLSLFGHKRVRIVADGLKARIFAI